MDVNDIILRFFRDDTGGILILNQQGETLYADEQAKQILQESKNWQSIYPRPYEGQKSEKWDLPNKNGETYMVISSTFMEGGEMVQIHHFIENSVYMELYKDMGAYSRELRQEKEHDGLTKLYNKGKFMELKQSLFKTQQSIGIFYMDLNYLKRTNDNYGHEAGDLLIKKAAESLHRMERPDVMTFRIGGDEFLLVALNKTGDQVDALHREWQDGLDDMNRRDDGIPCSISCGVAFGEEGYVLDDLLALAEQRMYEEKIRMKAGR